MEFNDVVNSRYSVRKFSDKKVEKEKIERIMHCANVAPTAKNTNCVRVYAVTNEKVLEKFNSEVSPCIYGATVVFAVCSDESVSWKSDYSGSRGVMDASIAADHIMLSAVNEGLGTCWVCLFTPDKLKEALSIKDENIVPHCLIVCGYAADDAMPSERHTMRIDRVTYVD